VHLNIQQRLQGRPCGLRLVHRELSRLLLLCFAKEQLLRVLVHQPSSRGRTPAVQRCRQLPRRAVLRHRTFPQRMHAVPCRPVQRRPERV
jgi:hypothetical protein